MKIELKPYGLVYCDNADIYDVYTIIIDTEDKKLDLCDNIGMSIGTIYYENCKEVGYLKYNNRERLTGESEIIISDGEIIYKGD